MLESFTSMLPWHWIQWGSVSLLLPWQRIQWGSVSLLFHGFVDADKYLSETIQKKSSEKNERKQKMGHFNEIWT